MESTETHPVCLITGGSSGIGLATAKRFRAAGFHVAICGRDPENLKEAAAAIQAIDTQDGKSGSVLTRQVDLADPDQAKKFAEGTISELGSINVLVNNAGLAPLENFELITPEMFESLLNVNVRSHFYLTQLVWQNMLANHGGTIVNISSLSAVDPFPGFSLYGASKAWMDLLTLSLAAEGKDKNIRICSIRPGAVETPLLRGLFPEFPSDQCVAPEEIAEHVLGCVQDPQKYPSGEFFPVTSQQADEVDGV